MPLPLKCARSSILCLCAASVASCAFLSAVFEDHAAAGKIDRAYDARDVCLRWAIVRIDDGRTDPTQIGTQAVRSCREQTDALVKATDAHADAAIASNIDDDSTLRATAYVINSRRIARSLIIQRSL